MVEAETEVETACGSIVQVDGRRGSGSGCEATEGGPCALKQAQQAALSTSGRAADSAPEQSRQLSWARERRSHLPVKDHQPGPDVLSNPVQQPAHLAAWVAHTNGLAHASPAANIQRGKEKHEHGQQRRRDNGVWTMDDGRWTKGGRDEGRGTREPGQGSW